MIEDPTLATDSKINFFLRSAKAWQRYFDARGLLPNIELSNEQIGVIQQSDEQMLINGSAGSGKSITLLYKLIKVMEQEEEKQRILCLTFNRTLIDDARKRARLSELYNQLKHNHTVHFNTFHSMAYSILKKMGFNNVKYFDTNMQSIKRHYEKLLGRLIIIKEAYTNSVYYNNLPQSERLFATQNPAFLLEEILWMKANGFINLQDYLEVERTGRSHNPRLTKAQRKTVYEIFNQYQSAMKEKYHNDLDIEDYALLLLKYFDQIPNQLYYDYIFVDEVQDLQPMQLKTLVCLAKKSIILSGDPKQRIYKRTPHTYANLGLQIQGRRNKTLTKNFRSTKQIMSLANALNFDDVQNDKEDHNNFVRDGEMPEIRYFPKDKAAIDYLTKSIKQIHANDPGSTVAVIHRYEEELYKRTELAIKSALERSFYLITAEQYNNKFDYKEAKKPIFFTDAYSVKGLEFDYVFITQFDRFSYPHHKKIEELEKRVEKKGSDTYEKDFDSIFNDEKKILYVAITRAKKKVVLLWVADVPVKVSQFIRDFDIDHYQAYGFNKNMYK